ncbi:MAG: Crp/Fnr family transcriptional regulator [Clostridiales bacterium]
MEFAAYFPIYHKLTPEEQVLLESSVSKRRVAAGTMMHNGADDCVGLFILSSGQLRAYILSDEGKEITLYRLFERDICLFSASCIMSSIQFDITIEAEKDSELWIIPPDIYKELMDSSAIVAGYTNQIMATRFSEVMWLMEQIMWKSFDKRLAAFLLEESALEESSVLHLTHEKIANHLGTAREVVTRMLRYFQSEQMVRLTRGAIEIADRQKLKALGE